MAFMLNRDSCGAKVFDKRIVEPEFGIAQFLNEIQDYESGLVVYHQEVFVFI